MKQFLLKCRNGHEAWPVLRQYLYAHRGFHGDGRTENSMAAFRAAVEHGFGAELDVHLLKDGNLAIMHDSSLLRTAGADVCIEDLTKEELSAYTLLNGEKVPLLEEVLELFRNETPLIIELKSTGKNAGALSAAVAKVLDDYTGDYCIESFDPRVVRWFRKNRPDVCRGQLSYYFLKDKTGKRPFWQKLAMAKLWVNRMGCPDFVAYDFSDRDRTPLRYCRDTQKTQIVYWTIRSQKDMDEAIKEGGICIFEAFLPRGYGENEGK